MVLNFLCPMHHMSECHSPPPPPVFPLSSPSLSKNDSTQCAPSWVCCLWSQPPCNWKRGGVNSYCLTIPELVITHRRREKLLCFFFYNTPERVYPLINTRICTSTTLCPAPYVIFIACFNLPQKIIITCFNFRKYVFAQRLFLKRFWLITHLLLLFALPKTWALLLVNSFSELDECVLYDKLWSDEWISLTFHWKIYGMCYLLNVI